MAIKVLLVDDQSSMRSALRVFLAAKPGIEVVGEADDGAAAVRLAGELSPDVVVMDLFLPGLDGIEATCQIKNERPETGVVLLSARADGASRTRAFAAGAAACVTKLSAFDELEGAIHLAGHARPNRRRSRS
jgi:DNA-binding NarL/FixJ family response regulator